MFLRCLVPASLRTWSSSRAWCIALPDPQGQTGDSPGSEPGTGANQCWIPVLIRIQHWGLGQSCHLPSWQDRSGGSSRSQRLPPDLAACWSIPGDAGQLFKNRCTGEDEQLLPSPAAQASSKMHPTHALGHGGAPPHPQLHHGGVPWVWHWGASTNVRRMAPRELRKAGRHSAMAPRCMHAF